MNKRDQMKSDYAKVHARLGKTTGASKGSKPPPKPKITPSGTNPLKKKVGIKAKWTF